MKKESLAAGTQPLGPINGIGDIGNPGTESPAVLAQMISTTIGLLTVIAAIYFLFILITGSISIISSGGEKGAYENARQRITTGLIGLVVTVSGIFIMDVVATLLGIESILDLVTTIGQISPQ